MRILLSASALIGLLALSGCSAAGSGITGPCPTPPRIDEPSTSTPAVDWFSTTADIVLTYSENLVGFDEAAAEKCVVQAELEWRVVARDGEYFAVTADYVPMRVNVVVVDEVVTEVSVG